MSDRFIVADAYAPKFYLWDRDFDLPIAELTHIVAMKDWPIERFTARHASRGGKACFCTCKPGIAQYLYTSFVYY